MSEWTRLVESGRSIVATSRLAGDNGTSADKKFALGDLLVDAGGLDDEQLSALAEEIGHGLTGHNLKSYLKWPGHGQPTGGSMRAGRHIER
jgi:hypothetical protein